MDRLTQRREDGTIETTREAYSDFHMEVVDCTRGNDRHDVRLAAYEDTGLMPEEVAALKDQLAVTGKALGLACEDSEHLWAGSTPDELVKQYLEQAKDGLSRQEEIKASDTPEPCKCYQCPKLIAESDGAGGGTFKCADHPGIVIGEWGHWADNNNPTPICKAGGSND